MKISYILNLGGLGHQNFQTKDLSSTCPKTTITIICSRLYSLVIQELENQIYWADLHVMNSILNQKVLLVSFHLFFHDNKKINVYPFGTQQQQNQQQQQQQKPRRIVIYSLIVITCCARIIVLNINLLLKRFLYTWIIYFT